MSINDEMQAAQTRLSEGGGKGKAALAAKAGNLRGVAGSAGSGLRSQMTQAAIKRTPFTQGPRVGGKGRPMKPSKGKRAGGKANYLASSKQPFGSGAPKIKGTRYL